ncbi:Putative DNA-binding protein [Mycobacteroides abscessus subsp. abscessus]|uniref:hypothetical protein n=1 Tax=Mycobacteroides TaxID=670516 RepID=UPI00069778F2|nr:MULTISPECIES: hypothetical protein [Mycobacteroides]ANO03624.1 hypothetical protein BAB75_09715 [Mycobacteroides immunogenum]MCV7306680.1 hypothetical protein [Mycobacteroides immunogenum]ORV77668.1 hypothetical protein AWC10_16110 [Mycobacteroides immunogenum]SID66850.1 Putative DNA-binding protein [Mycobacteroides abscessus subsp. abscessus]SIF70340.1 Putative DNA-binding protein [Mycobacteroides abscessus subsp. abscessus]
MSWQQEQTNRVGQAVRALRGTRSVTWVSDETEKLGCKVTKALITDMEIGRRKYVAVHEISVLAAALGVTPAVLLTWGDMPDAEVEVLPDRRARAELVADWWGGKPLGQGLPRDQKTSELMHLTRQRQDTKKLLFRARLRPIKDTTPLDQRLIKELRDRLVALEADIRATGGVIGDGGDDG